ncbi:hypothetical protein J6590_052723 [Homalodisca vitripennis]|nr:hypothetical protein J6590_052723 [Homalodisca vitripennis]
MLTLFKTGSTLTWTSQSLRDVKLGADKDKDSLYRELPMAADRTWRLSKLECSLNLVPTIGQKLLESVSSQSLRSSKNMDLRQAVNSQKT